MSLGGISREIAFQLLGYAEHEKGGFMCLFYNA